MGAFGKGHMYSVLALACAVIVFSCKAPNKGQIRSVGSPTTRVPNGPLAPLGPSQPCPVAAPYPGTNAVNPQMTYSNNPACAARAPGLSKSIPPFESLSVQDRPSPNYRSRYGASITGIVLHHTTGAFEGAVAHLRTPSSKVSAHMVVGRDGQIARLVAEDNVAWHAAGANTNTLGIEIEATVSQRGLTDIQERHLVSLIEYWMKRYNIASSQVKGHRSHIPTECPSYIWPSDGDLVSWIKKVGL